MRQKAYYTKSDTEDYIIDINLPMKYIPKPNGRH